MRVYCIALLRKLSSQMPGNTRWNVAAKCWYWRKISHWWGDDQRAAGGSGHRPVTFSRSKRPVSG
ncbi:MAG: hypothetical protein G5703_05025 [Serratia symbiotica]|nr:hypothetical protein [Serratia symbiotica]